MPPVDWLAVVAATAASFAIGALWYSPLLFAKAWQRESGVTDEQARGGMAVIFGGAFVLMFLAAAVFAMFLGPEPGLAFGAGAGFAAGLFWVAASCSSGAASTFGSLTAATMSPRLPRSGPS